MIEPTETESKETLDHLSMPHDPILPRKRKRIQKGFWKLLTNTPVKRLDEVTATAGKPVLRWQKED